jgi:hypothetical protein
MLRTWLIPTIVLSALSASSALAQEKPSRVGPRRLLPPHEEIALARSAAPAAISRAARVYVLTAEGYVVADSGTRGVSCYVSRSWPESLEPHCFDEEGARTIMPIDMREVELLHLGHSTEETDREIAAGITSGRFRLPQRPALSWMMSSAQVLYNDEGRRVGSWRPHLMIYFPYLTEQALGLAGAQDPGHGLVVGGGRAMSNIMIVVPKFSDPEPAAGTAPRPPD